MLLQQRVYMEHGETAEEFARLVKLAFGDHTFAPMKGTAAVAMLRSPNDLSGILLPDKVKSKSRPTVGIVLWCDDTLARYSMSASGKKRFRWRGAIGLAPGNVVIVNPKDGKRIEGFEMDPIRHRWPVEREVRLYGRAAHKVGLLETVPLDESVLAIIRGGMISPLGTRLLVRLSERKDHTDSGIFLPDHHHDREDIATVVEVGPECEEVKAGDRVIFERRGLTEIGIEGDPNLAILPESAVYTTVT